MRRVKAGSDVTPYPNVEPNDNRSQESEDAEVRHVPLQPDDMPDGHERTGDFSQPQTTEQTDDGVFPASYMAPVEGLLVLGHMTTSFEFARHQFVIRTLTEGEIIRIGQLIRYARGTSSETEALKAYTVAACVVSVDGEAVSPPYKSGYDQIFENAKVVRKWYPIVIGEIYKRYAELESSAEEYALALKN